MTHKTTRAPRTGWWRTTMTRRRGFLFATALLGATACGSDSGTGPGNRLAGTYILEEIGTVELPALIHQGPWLDRTNTRFYNKYIVSIYSGMVELDGGEFLIELDGSVNADGQTFNNTAEVEGTYEVKGSTISFMPASAPGAVVTARIEDGAIVLPLDLMGKGAQLDYVFRR